MFGLRKELQTCHPLHVVLLFTYVVMYLCRYYEIIKYGAGFKKGDTVSLLDTFRRQQELSEAGVANGGAAKAGADADTNMDVHTGVATAMLQTWVPNQSRPADQLKHRDDSELQGSDATQLARQSIPNRQLSFQNTSFSNVENCFGFEEEFQFNADVSHKR